MYAYTLNPQLIKEFDFKFFGKLILNIDNTLLQILVAPVHRFQENDISGDSY